MKNYIKIYAIAFAVLFFCIPENISAARYTTFTRKKMYVRPIGGFDYHPTNYILIKRDYRPNQEVALVKETSFIEDVGEVFTFFAVGVTCCYLIEKIRKKLGYQSYDDTLICEEVVEETVVY